MAQPLVQYISFDIQHNWISLTISYDLLLYVSLVISNIPHVPPASALLILKRILAEAVIIEYNVCA